MARCDAAKVLIAFHRFHSNHTVEFYCREMGRQSGAFVEFGSESGYE
jgi:hypothetical protein